MSANEEPLQCLRLFIQTLIEEMQADRCFHRLIQWEFLDADAERLAFLGNFIFSKVHQPFIHLLEKLKPGCDAVLLSDMIFGMAKQHFEMEPVLPHMSTHQAGERTATEVVDMMLSVLTPFFQEAGK